MSRGWSGHRIRLYLPEGEDIGEFATSELNWQVGEEVRVSGNSFRIENIAWFEEGDFAGAFVVTQLQLAEPG